MLVSGLGTTPIGLASVFAGTFLGKVTWDLYVFLLRDLEHFSEGMQHIYTYTEQRCNWYSQVQLCH